MNENPLISVVIPAFNRARTISSCLTSVLEQTYRNIEVIVVDDCSTDNTADVVRNNPDPRLRCVALENNSGAQAARNRGIREAKGDWIAFQDSDDEWLVDSIEVRLRRVEREGADVAYSGCRARYYPDTTLRPYFIRGFSGNVQKDLLRVQGPLFQGMLVKKYALERIGYLDEAIVSFQEWDTSIMLARHHTFTFTPEPTFIYNLHEGDTISGNSLRAAQGYEQVFRKHYEDMEKMLSCHDMANHYWILAKLYQKAKQYDRANDYAKRMISSYPLGRNLPRIASYLLRQLLDRSLFSGRG